MSVARWSQRSSGEEKRFKERDGAWCRGSAAAGSRSDHLLVLALGAGLDDGTLALDRRKRAAVEIVDVTPDLQLPIVVDKRTLIGQVHPDLRGLQLNILLRPAEHLLNLLDR